MKRQSQRLMAVICLLAVMPVSTYSFAQSGNLTGKSPVPIEVSLLSAGTFKYFEAKYFSKVVKGAPYSATAITEHMQTLSDGNQIIRKKEAKVYRDGEGRTRFEQKLDTIGKWTASGDAPQMVYINDPVTGFSYNLDPNTRTVRKSSTFKYSTLNQNIDDEKRRRAQEERVREQEKRAREHEERVKEQNREREERVKEQAREHEERVKEQTREREERIREHERQSKERIKEHEERVREHQERAKEHNRELEIRARERNREYEERARENGIRAKERNREHEMRIREHEERMKQLTREHEARMKQLTREYQTRIKEHEERVKRQARERDAQIKTRNRENELRTKERNKEYEKRLKEQTKEDDRRLKEQTREYERRLKEQTREYERRIQEHKEQVKFIEQQNEKRFQSQEKSETSNLPTKLIGGAARKEISNADGRKEISNADGRKKIESLGKQTIEGVEVEGTRSTSAIPAGEIGNTLPIDVVDENWYSPDLQVLVMTRHHDPRSGVITYRLSNIRRSEPERALFEIPVDYISVQEKKPVKVAGIKELAKPAEPAKKPVMVKKAVPDMKFEPMKKIEPIKKATPMKKLESTVIKNELYQ